MDQGAIRAAIAPNSTAGAAAEAISGFTAGTAPELASGMAAG